MNVSSDTQTPEQPPFPTVGRLLGIDYGTKRLGIAVTNQEQTIASPLENYTRQGVEQDARYLRRVIQEYRATGLIVGLPVHMSGDEGGKAREARAFGQWLFLETGLPVRFGDERFSSLIAEQHLLNAELSKKKRKARLDMLAAQLILQAYLDRTHKTEPPGPM
jgi:putative Holliday junction resolvase